MPQPVRSPNIAPDCFSTPRQSPDGLQELCHLVASEQPDISLCGRDVTGYPWNPPWPLCEACLAVAHGQMS